MSFTEFNGSPPAPTCLRTDQDHRRAIIRYKIGDAMRLRDGSRMRDGLDAWADATGKVLAVFDDRALVPAA